MEAALRNHPELFYRQHGRDKGRTDGTHQPCPEGLCLFRGILLSALLYRQRNGQGYPLGKTPYRGGQKDNETPDIESGFKVGARPGQIYSHGRNDPDVAHVPEAARNKRYGIGRQVGGCRLHLAW